MLYFLCIQTELCETSATDNNKVILYWKPSEKPFDKFRVEYKEENKSTYRELPSNNITKLDCIIETLPADILGSSYQFRVAAINKKSPGPFTDPITTNSKLYVCRYIHMYIAIYVVL